MPPNVQGNCNTLVLTPFALNVYDVYIVINRGVELKKKAPSLIYRFMFRRLKLMQMVFCSSHIIIMDTMYICKLIKIPTTNYVNATIMRRGHHS